ncbi:hypothetical protein DL764_005189 [Monosporascus ibericus]|uniref:DUF2423 domain-containing protein n=1 Tax=Monosporascus ibericus TaxID=155417 RepID=A0A4Q4TCP9_9PEZI|nr:hypothetical protein DL764_005189 [Monosporascus ibericus]
MAKSSRASTRKANNRRLKANVFGPVESARAERLSAKLLELASQPKPEVKEVKVAEDVEAAEEEEEAEAMMEEDTAAAENANDTMDVDNTTTTAAKSASSNKKRDGKGRIQKRKKKANKVVFALYKDKKSSKRKH